MVFLFLFNSRKYFLLFFLYSFTSFSDKVFTLQKFVYLLEICWLLILSVIVLCPDGTQGYVDLSEFVKICFVIQDVVYPGCVLSRMWRIRAACWNRYWGGGYEIWLGREVAEIIHDHPNTALGWDLQGSSLAISVPLLHFFIFNLCWVGFIHSYFRIFLGCFTSVFSSSCCCVLFDKSHCRSFLDVIFPYDSSKQNLKYFRRVLWALGCTEVFCSSGIARLRSESHTLPTFSGRESQVPPASLHTHKGLCCSCWAGLGAGPEPASLVVGESPCTSTFEQTMVEMKTDTFMSFHIVRIYLRKFNL